MFHSTLEVEIKLPFESAADATECLSRAGAIVLEPRHFEDNVAYDRPTEPLFGSGRLLRLRRKGEEAVLTFKGPGLGGGPHKVREERETRVADAEAMGAILERLGFLPRYRYQKYRTVFSLGGLVACLDETPIGCFVELEGTPEAIDRVAQQLGFAPAQYMRESYRELHERHSRQRGVAMGDLLIEPSGQ
jgi:adenylate cyclase, class 2